MLNSNLGSETSLNANRPVMIIQYHNNASQIQHILPNNAHFLQKQNELITAIEESGFVVTEIYVSMDAIVHTNTDTRYICKVQFTGSGIPSFSSTKEDEHYLDIAIANLNDAIQFIRDTKERLKDKNRDKIREV
jgi:hypothetical protein